MLVRTCLVHREPVSVEVLRLGLTEILGSLLDQVPALTNVTPGCSETRGRPDLSLLSVAHLLPKGCPESQSWS